jgi:hypothetical protein
VYFLKGNKFTNVVIPSDNAARVNLRLYLTVSSFTPPIVKLLNRCHCWVFRIFSLTQFEDSRAQYASSCCYFKKHFFRLSRLSKCGANRPCLERAMEVHRGERAPGSVKLHFVVEFAEGQRLKTAVAIDADDYGRVAQQKLLVRVCGGHRRSTDCIAGEQPHVIAVTGGN